MLDDFTLQTKYTSEKELLAKLGSQLNLSPQIWQKISDDAAGWVAQIRANKKHGLMEYFLAQYSLSTDEGVALMCLAEAMLRTPDNKTIDRLIADKIIPLNWRQHLRASPSALVNIVTWELCVTQYLLTQHNSIKQFAKPFIRYGAHRAMQQMGKQFILGENIDKALKNSGKYQARGFTYSYDMLGEAAITAQDAAFYYQSYQQAITAIGASCHHHNVIDNAGISVKLSALHPRYEVAQEKRVMAEIVPILHSLATNAKNLNIGLNIDAEEQARLVLSLKIIEAVFESKDLADWDGFGVVVQAYGKRASYMLDWLYRLAKKHQRKIMVRLVKGAYWDSEMKWSQIEGASDFPLFTTKAATDVSYIANVKKLFDYSDYLYPQLATHNAHTMAAVLALANKRDFEFQRLHGMGETLHDIMVQQLGHKSRIYAPVGAYPDLLAYLVRRLLENGANSSFVHQIMDSSITPEQMVHNPMTLLPSQQMPKNLVKPSDIFGDTRVNSKGFDINDEQTLLIIEQARNVPIPDAIPLIVGGDATGERVIINNPANGEKVATLIYADKQTVMTAIDSASAWHISTKERATILRIAADLYEQNFGLLFAVLTTEAGKTLPDAIGELREAVDFLRYYANEAEKIASATQKEFNGGIFTAISPWNFPLAIFTGQIAAALAMGNGVLAKPAEQTSLTAFIAVQLLHQAGVPPAVLQLMTGEGATIGTILTQHPKISGVVFTGSTETAQIIRRNMAHYLSANAPLIAETGGLNAMIVDSTALPEQAVRDVIISAFQSAGQRCSALRCLYIQEEIADSFLEMLKGAMDELTLGDPYQLSTDIGPLIDEQAKQHINAYIAEQQVQGKLLYQLDAPSDGCFVAPCLIQVSDIEEMQQEIFGPVLHIATFKSDAIDDIITAINQKGFGLTFGLHSRITAHIDHIAARLKVGNIYVNRNQIGAIVGSQPFGGEGLSGTGPKAGGPLYVQHFAKTERITVEAEWQEDCDSQALQHVIDNANKQAKERVITQKMMPQKMMPQKMMKGVTGESNHWRTVPRGAILCLGPTKDLMAQQIKHVTEMGGIAVGIEGALAPEILLTLQDFYGVIYWGKREMAEDYAKILSKRTGAIIPLITIMPHLAHIAHERHICIDTTASGGNAALLTG
ncbi:MAG: bifunctional proline dehydrogenase/L-glutamate gamma-semialdehyde dehydrogenase PutA [Alphaproteobacteria bacterium]|nr:bifunctional proline dehydrogenase/L-glutamate gamma-semialdehyde dehydrogenase PutA [Alphaproteobacteria bacterium]